jgi:ABC-type transport system involved in multi-copper enzyme maturation permease subunit
MLLIHIPNIVVFVNVANAIAQPNTVTLQEFWDYAGQPFPVIAMLFAAVVGPDLFCADRREHVLSLYFASPITRLQYAVARAAALAILLLTLTLLPMLQLFVGHALLATSAADYVRGNLPLLGHAVLAGVLEALLFASVASAVSSLSDRKVNAGGTFAGIMLVSLTVGDLIATNVKFTSHEKFILVDLMGVGMRTARWILGTTPWEGQSGALSQDVFAVSGWAYLGVSLLVTAVAAAILIVRYQRMRDV